MPDQSLEALRQAERRVKGVLAEVEKTRTWRSATGMKPASDTSRFAMVVPTGLREIEWAMNDLLTIIEPARVRAEVAASRPRITVVQGQWDAEAEEALVVAVAAEVAAEGHTEPEVGRTPVNEASVVEAAVAWNDARKRALELKYARAAEVCENESQPEIDTGWKGEPPCWRQYEYTGFADEQKLKARAEWCAPCLRRQAIHEQYRAAVKQRGIEMRRLERLAQIRPPEVGDRKEGL